jgi:hypothetical protein
MMTMIAHAVTPILNVTSIAESFAWFERLGWKRGFDWGNPPTFGAVCSGASEIFLCQGAQGGRGKSSLPTTKGHGEAGDKGAWMSIAQAQRTRPQTTEHGQNRKRGPWPGSAAARG